MPPKQASAGPASRTRAQPMGLSASSANSGSFTSRGSPRSTSCITSASVLASKPVEFTQWADLVGLDPEIKETIPIGSFSQPILDIQRGSTRFPSWLANKDSLNFGHIAPRHHNWVIDICSNVARSTIYTLDGDDIPELPSALVPIFQICHHHKKVWRRQKLESESDLRICIDSLIIHCCETGEGEELEYSTEQILKLPSAVTGRFNIPTTKADGVCSVDMPGFTAFETNLDFRRMASAFDGIGSTPQKIFSLIHCVTEYKREGSGENQAVMGIISALYQKRVLGLEQFVFGVFQLQTDFIDVVVGAWQNGKATIYRLGRYSLGSPPHMVEFYLTLRGINRLASEYTTELTNLGHAIGERFRIKPPKSVWAKNTGEPMKTIHEAPGESSNQEQRRGTNVQSGLSHRLSTLESWDIHDRIISYLGSTSSIISDDSAYLADTSDTSDGGLEVPQSIAGHISLEAIPKFDAVEMDRCGFVPVASTRHLAPHNSLSPSDGLDSSDDDPEFPQSPPLDMLAGQPCPNIDFVGNSKAAFREHGEMQSLDPALSA